jgi:hypothetical protein
MYAPSHRARATSGRSLGKVVDPYFNRTAKHFCSHQHTPPQPQPSEYDAAVLGDGTLYLAHPVFGIYQDKGAVAVKQYAAAAIDILLQRRTVRTSLPSFGRVTVARQAAERRTVVHPLAAAPLYRGAFRRGPIEVVEDLITLADVDVAVKVEGPVGKVKLEPQNVELPFVVEDGEVRFTIPRLPGLQIVAVQDA